MIRSSVRLQYQKERVEKLEKQVKKYAEEKENEWLRTFGDLLADDVSDFRPFFESVYGEGNKKKPPSKTEDMMERQSGWHSVVWKEKASDSSSMMRNQQGLPP